MKTMAFAVLALSLSSGAALAAKDKEDVVWPAEAIKWNAGPIPGTRIAPLWGAMNKDGPFGVMVKFDAGLMHPLHHHTRTLKLVIVSGTMVHTGESGTETRLGPGSYLLQAGGKKHISGCAAGAECTFFMTSDGKFDMIDDSKAASGGKK